MIGAGLTSELFPKLRDEVCANMDVHRGALTEAFMAFFYVLFKLGFDKIYPTDVITRAFIWSAYKLMLRLLAGGCMNPASVSSSLFFSRTIFPLILKGHSDLKLPPIDILSLLSALLHAGSLLNLLGLQHFVLNFYLNNETFLCWEFLHLNMIDGHS